MTEFALQAPATKRTVTTTINCREAGDGDSDDSDEGHRR